MVNFNLMLSIDYLCVDKGFVNVSMKPPNYTELEAQFQTLLFFRSQPIETITVLNPQHYIKSTHNTYLGTQL